MEMTAETTKAAVEAVGAAATRRLSPRPLDFVAVAAAIAITVVSAFFVYGGSFSEAKAIVESGGQTWVLPLSKDATLDVPGPLGITVVEVENRSIHVHSSPCKNQVCVASGSISKPGEWLACLPNGVIIRIEGNRAIEEPDLTSW